MDTTNDPLEIVLPLLNGLITDALTASLKKINDLGGNGKVKISAGSLHIGKDTDIVLRADGESELAMLAVLDEFGKSYNVRFLVFGEEIGWRVVGDISSRIMMTAFLDGIDGTDNYSRNSVFDSGPMICLCRGHNPTFNEVLAGGIALISTGWILIADAYRNQVTWNQTNTYKNTQILKPFARRGLPKSLTKSVLLADDYAPKAKEVLSLVKFKFMRTGSTAATIVLIALQGYERDSELTFMNGDYPVLVLDQFDKGEIEQPALYLIMKILGGIMVSVNGVDNLGSRAILQTGSNARPPEVVLFTLAPTVDLYIASLELIGPYL